MSNPEFHRDRREHGGAPQRLDDDRLAEIAEDERVEAGLDDYNPDEVPPATDPLPPGTPEPPHNWREDEAYEEERAELLREANEGELHSPDERDPFPPTRYELAAFGRPSRRPGSSSAPWQNRPGASSWRA
jgi:hypothetical protein